MRVNPSDPITVAFLLDPTIREFGDGIYEIEGLLHFDGATLQLEFRSTKMSMERTPVRTLTFEASRIASIAYKAGLFGAKLILLPTRLGTFEHVPGDHSDQLVLSVKRESRAAANNLASLFEINRPPPLSPPRQ